ncbi:MAG: SHOCT domain-containing protein [Actinobacteria bacterium]|nr:SHOCT domain-containing protein [Actinomycetota bacterium]
MHNGNWHDGMGNGNWWWIPMMIMMVAFWGGLIWLGVSLLKRNNSPQSFAAGSAPATPTAEGILGERLARGEIEADEYHKRLTALRTPPNT